MKLLSIKNNVFKTPLKIILNSILITMLGSMLISCSSITTQPDWDFIQSVGGLEIKALELDEGVYYLPVNMSVASYKPGTKSELVCTESSARIAGKQILLRIRTDTKKNVPQASARCPKAKVGGIPDGNYRVMHVGPKGKINKAGDVVANLSGF